MKCCFDDPGLRGSRAGADDVQPSCSRRCACRVPCLLPPFSRILPAFQAGDAKSLYGNELPFLNPQDGTVTINGTTLNMGSFREIEARFNKYLSQPEESTEDAKEYQKNF